MTNNSAHNKPPSAEKPRAIHRASIGSLPWWPVSVAIHVIVLVYLVFFTPVRELVMPTADRPVEPDLVMRPERVEELAEMARDLKEAELRQVVDELEQIRGELEQLEQAKYEQFEQFAEADEQFTPSESSDPREVLDAQQRALEAQREALERQEQVTDPLNQAEQQEAVREAQATVREAQIEALSKLTKPYDPMRSPREAQERADEAQNRANEAQGVAIEARSAIHHAQVRVERAQTSIDRAQRRIDRFEKDVDRWESEIAKAGQKLDEARRKLDESQSLQSDAQQRLENAEQTIEQAESTLRDNRDDAQAKAALGEARDAHRDATNDIRRAERDAARAGNEIERYSSDVTDRKGRLAEAKQNLGGAREELAEAESELAQAKGDVASQRVRAQEAQADVAKLQRQAIDQQTRAMEAVGQWIADQASRSADATDPAEPSNQSTDQATTTNPWQQTDTSALWKMDVADLYDHAVETERRITGAYRNIRATELAMIRRIPFSEAHSQTDVAQPERPDLSQQLRNRDVRTVSQLAEHRDAAVEAVDETESMVELASGLRELARGMNHQGESGLSVDLAGIAARADRQAKLRAMASEDEGGAEVADISGLMQEGSGTPPQDLADSQGGHGSSGPSSADKDESATDTGRHHPSISFPPKLAQPVQAVPGRKVTATTGQSGQWMFIDSWYTIGPFPNPDRVNIDRAFAPESVIDLDAAYVGVGNRTVRWQFVQSGNPRVKPADMREYAIYYAYTELWFDEPRDMWIAAGSDDRATLWINGDPVWISSEQLKALHLDEWVKRVHFRKGLNRILYRVENGWRACEFSLMLHVGDQAGQ